jgi:hypothetical protein
VLAAMHAENPVLAEGIVGFLAAPPKFGALSVSVRNGKLQTVELKTTIARE